MNRYQQALNTLREKGYTNHFQPITLEYQYFNEFKILQELVDKQSNPTLSECIKEWKDRGYIVESEKITNGIYIYKNNKLKTKIVFIRKTKLKTKIKTTCRLFCIADYELLNLIHKTLKTLEEMKDE